jgi:menaquinone-dependent protoporphyrinogen oxidase
MAATILVAYGTRKGSTGEVAEAIARTLGERGFEVELKPAGEAKRDLGRFDGFVIGGALYRGRGHTQARKLLERLRKLPASKPVAVFGLGPRRNEEASFERASIQLGRALARVPEVEPFAVTVFGGVHHKKGTDIRDWDRIRAWAEQVGEAFGSSR